MVNSGGTWMALFALAGLLMLAVAGDRIERRMNERRTVAPDAAAAVATETELQRTKPGAADYSLRGLRWILLAAAGCGVIWAFIELRLLPKR